MAVYRGTMPEIVERHDILIGTVDGPDACGHCQEGDEFLSKAKPDYKYKYRFVPDGTKTAQKLRKEHKIRSKYVPAIIDCKRFADGTEKCDKVIGFDRKQWTDLKRRK